MKSSTGYTPTLPKSLLFIGSPGSGKTTFALQLPKVYAIDCDDNLGGPVRHLRSTSFKGVFKYDSPFTDAAGKPLARELQFNRVIDLISEAVSDPDVETVVIDSLSTLIEMMFYHILKIQNKTLAKDFKSVDKKFEFEDWAAFGNLLRRLIFELKASGKRFIITAHIKVEQDELTKSLYKFINCPGQTANYLSGWFEEAWEFYIQTSGMPPNEKATRKIRTVPDARSQPLGLKSAAGFAATMDADATTILAKLS